MRRGVIAGALFDNVVVTPEPGTLIVLTALGLPLLRRRL